MRLCFILPALCLLSCTVTRLDKSYPPFIQALNSYLEGDNKEALAILENIYRNHPEFSESTALYGRVLFYEGQYGQARSVLERLLNNETTMNLDSGKLLLRAYLNLGNMDLANDLINRMLSYSSEDPEILYLSARCFLVSGKTEAAFLHLKAACSLMERQIEIPLELAALYSSFGLNNEASVLLDQYANILTEDHPLRNSMDSLLSELKKKAHPPQDEPS